MRKEMSKPTFFQMFVPGDSNANPHVFFPLFYKVVRINLLGGNQPLDIHYSFIPFKRTSNKNLGYLRIITLLRVSL